MRAYERRKKQVEWDETWRPQCICCCFFVYFFFVLAYLLFVSFFWEIFHRSFITYHAHACRLGCIHMHAHAHLVLLKSCASKIVGCWLPFGACEDIENVRSNGNRLWQPAAKQQIWSHNSIKKESWCIDNCDPWVCCHVHHPRDQFDTFIEWTTFWWIHIFHPRITLTDFCRDSCDDLSNDGYVTDSIVEVLEYELADTSASEDLYTDDGSSDDVRFVWIARTGPYSAHHMLTQFFIVGINWDGGGG